MAKYVNRLIKCGYTRKEAIRTCLEFIIEFGIVELQNFIRWAESNVD